MNCLPLQPASQGLVEAQSLARPQPVLHPDLLLTKQGVEPAAGGPPAQLGPGQGEVGDELVGGGEPRQEDLILTAGLGAAIVPGYQSVNLPPGCFTPGRDSNEDNKYYDGG